MCMHASYLRMIGGSDFMLCVCSFKECLSNFIDKFSSLVTEDNSRAAVCAKYLCYSK